MSPTASGATSRDPLRDEIASGLQGTPAAGDAATTAFVDALNHIILIAAVIAFVSLALALVLIRQRDFVGVGASRDAPPAQGSRV